MTTYRLQNALRTYGALYVTIGFKVMEIKDKTFISDGQSQFTYNVQKNRKQMLSNAIYNAVKKEFPNRTVTPYDIHILQYHYTYFLNDYDVYKNKDDNKLHETYTDIKTGEKRDIERNKYELREKTYIFIPDYDVNIIN